MSQRKLGVEVAVRALLRAKSAPPLPGDDRFPGPDPRTWRAMLESIRDLAEIQLRDPQRPAELRRHAAFIGREVDRLLRGGTRAEVRRFLLLAVQTVVDGEVLRLLSERLRT